MFRKLAIASCLGIALLFTSGCAMYQARFSPPVLQESTVHLRENDFRYVERNLRGEYAYWSITLGGVPLFMPGLEIPFDDPRLFSNALADMYSNSQTDVEGSSAQLVNWKYDAEHYVIPIPYITPGRKTAIFRADLIEFERP